MKTAYRNHICPICNIYNQCHGQKLEEMLPLAEGVSMRILKCVEFEREKEEPVNGNEPN